MALAFSVVEQGSAFAVLVKDQPLSTPGKHAVMVPTRALAEAIAAEWQEHQKFSMSKMPLTSLAYTAIDRIAGNEEAIIEALMVYVDTDTLSYRSVASEKMAERQKKEWDPVLGWMGKRTSAIWQVTSGVMPLAQPDAIHQHIEGYLRGLDAMQLSAACILISLFSSIVLGLAVLEKHLTAEKAFYLSRLEEEVQAEQWGHDAEMEHRKQRLQAEIMAAGRFLSLLER